MNGFYVWILWVNTLCGYSVWILCVDTMCGYYVWILCVDTMCGYSVWILCVDTVWILCVDTLSEYYVWILCVDTKCGYYVWILCVDTICEDTLCVYVCIPCVAKRAFSVCTPRLQFSLLIKLTVSAKIYYCVGVIISLAILMRTS